MAPNMKPTDTAVVTRSLDRTVEDVWERLTSSKGFEQWMGAGSSIEPEPGGGLIAADPESGEPKIGRILGVDHGHRLHWVWRPLGEESTTEVLVVIEPEPTRERDETGTVITVTEQPSSIPVATARAGLAVTSARVGRTASAAMAGIGR